MAGIRIDQLSDIVFRFLQILILAWGIFIILVFGSTFFRFNIWNAYSVLSLASGLIALALPALGSIAKAKNRSKELEWRRFDNQEKILLKTEKLQILIGLWNKSDDSTYPRPHPYDPDIRKLSEDIRESLRDIRKSINESIYLGDLDTAKKALDSIRSILHDTLWLQHWIGISLASSAQGQES